MKPLKQIVKDIPGWVAWVVGSALLVADVLIWWFNLHSR